MPPSRRSTSSRSAHKESSEIATDQSYTLGEYSFRIERSSVPGSSNDKIEAICTKDGKNARKSIQLPSSTQMTGWYVEANEATADVYAVVIPEQYNIIQPFIPSDLIPGNTYGTRVLTVRSGDSSLIKTVWLSSGIDICASQTPVGTQFYNESTHGWGTRYNATRSFTYQGKTVYWDATIVTFDYWNSFGSGVPSASQTISSDMLAWIMFYGMGGGEEEKALLVGRFAIDLEDAGGVGPGSDWDDPGDYDYDDYPDPDERDPDDPTYTLNLEVVGALSGRHNDPLEDTSYSYVPSDKATVKDYGCGGDGGNGGGGGAGASSVVVYKFPTSRADSKEITTIAKRHGYGSGGGKGGRGGDGCILVYY